MRTAKRYVFEYKGAVMHFDQVMKFNWNGKTIATSDKQAKNNLKHQYRMKHGLQENSQISLPGKMSKYEYI